MDPKHLLKRFLLFTLFIAPIAWLAISDVGQRHTGLFILSLKGEPTIELDFDALSHTLTEEQMRQQISDAEFSCSDLPSEFGNRSCLARIGGFNDNLAHLITFYYRDRRLQAVRILHRGYYPDHLLGQLVASLGNPERVTLPGEKGPTTLLRWRAGSGDLMLRESGPEPEEPPALLWVNRTNV